MDNLAREAALAGAELVRARFSVRENTGLGLIRLQTFHRKAGAVDDLAHRLGMQLPGPCESNAQQNMQLFWSSPGEWIIAVHAGTESEVIRNLQSKVEGLLVVFSVVTDSRVALDLAGDRVRDVLARGSTLDFHVSRFPGGHCANTRFAGVPVMLSSSNGGEIFLLLADRSLAHYLLEWFEAASADT